MVKRRIRFLFSHKSIYICLSQSDSPNLQLGRGIWHTNLFQRISFPQPLFSSSKMDAKLAWEVGTMHLPSWEQNFLMGWDPQTLIKHIDRIASVSRHIQLALPHKSIFMIFSPWRGFSSFYRNWTEFQASNALFFQTISSPNMNPL